MNNINHDHSLHVHALIEDHLDQNDIVATNSMHMQ